MRAGEIVCVCVYRASVCSEAGLRLDFVLDSLPLKGPGGWPTLARSFPRAECTLQKDIDFVGRGVLFFFFKRRRTEWERGRMDWWKKDWWSGEGDAGEDSRLLLDCCSGQRRTALLSGSVNHSHTPAVNTSLTFSFCPSLVFFLTTPAVFRSQHAKNRF